MSAADDTPSWYQTPAGIAVLAIFILGPLVLPIVWRSPALSERGRWIATVLVLLYTVILGWQIWEAFQIARAQLGI